MEIPEPLLPWLASQYTRSSDLTATLMTLERSILGNLSLQLQESQQQQSSTETITQTVAHTAEAAGMSEEVQHSHLILTKMSSLLHIK